MVKGDEMYEELEVKKEIIEQELSTCNIMSTEYDFSDVNIEGVKSLYRVKEFKKKNETSLFYVQKRFIGFLWWVNTYQYTWDEYSKWKVYYKFNTLEKAEAQIRYWIEKKEYYRGIEEGKQILRKTHYSNKSKL